MKLILRMSWPMVWAVLFGGVVGYFVIFTGPGRPTTWATIVVAGIGVFVVFQFFQSFRYAGRHPTPPSIG